LRLADTLPRRNPKAATPTRYGTAFWIERGDGAVLLRRRPEKGLLGGMMEVPSTEWTTSLLRNVETAAPLKTSWKKLKGKVEHTFTHFHLELSVLKAKPVIAIGELCPTYRWVPRQELYSEALPTVMRKVVALVLN
jgi:A/G-specific adenine glycosylase